MPLFYCSWGPTHSLRLDLASAPPGDHLLLGEGGVSLRTLSPPPGDGQSSASAKGGGELS